jgi:cyanophycin synthetase
VADEADAWAAALEVGPAGGGQAADGNQGKGITVNVTTRDGIALAYKAADEIGT